MSLISLVPPRSLPWQRLAEACGLDPGTPPPLSAALAETLAGRTIWNVNTTSQGGGVAELLHSLVPYVRGVGVDCRWAVIVGEQRFFSVTKRIHNRLHDSPGDGGPLDEQARRDYENAIVFNGADLRALVREGDVVILHDPQTAGLVRALEGSGAKVVWRCHVGVDRPTDLVRETWGFLEPYVAGADAIVFSRRDHVWEGFTDDRTWLIPPSIDPLAPKNQPLADATVAAILACAGLLAAEPAAEPEFVRADGSPGRVMGVADLVGPPPAPDVPLVVQVSRWDRLKDPIGVLRGFVDGVLPHGDAHLLLAGPSTRSIADDPEATEVLGEVRSVWDALPPAARERVTLACLPMDDLEDNAATVNALQRHASVIVQKSIAEGFGLTVGEAMWKARPVVASATGGIQDQIEHDRSGVLLADPHDLPAFGRALRDLLGAPERRERLGTAARERVRDHFLPPRHLAQYADVLGAVLAGAAP